MSKTDYLAACRAELRGLVAEEENAMSLCIISTPTEFNRYAHSIMDGKAVLHFCRDRTVAEKHMECYVLSECVEITHSTSEWRFADWRAYFEHSAGKYYIEGLGKCPYFVGTQKWYLFKEPNLTEAERYGSCGVAAADAARERDAADWNRVKEAR